MDPYTIFIAIGFTILIGFVANYLFRKYKAPDVLILIGLGFLLGPSMLGVIDTNLATYLDEFTPYVAALALAVIMFDAGLDLNFREVVLAFPKASFFTLMAFIVSMVVTSVLVHFALGWDLITSLLLGAILGGTSGAIVIALVNHLDVSKETKTLLTIEAALTDVLVIVVAMALIAFLRTGNGDATMTLGSMFISFGVSSIIGFVSGLIWLRMLTILSRQPFSYMITIAVLLLVFSVTELILQGGGGGSIAALVFGLTLGNHEYLERKLGLKKGRFSCDEEIKGFHTQITFFIRTFFFVYLGLVISSMNVESLHLLMGLGISLALLAARYLIVRGYVMKWKKKTADRLTMTYMLPRGLAAAVVASIPLSLRLVSIEVGETILGSTTIVILSTTVIASIAAFFIEKVAKREARFSSLEQNSG